MKEEIEYTDDDLREKNPDYVESPLPSNEDELKEFLNDVDFELAHLEDFTHGEHGKRITQMRKKLSEIVKKLKQTT